MILSALREHLTGDRALQHRIESRIYARRAPRSATFPYLLLSTISSRPEVTIGLEAGIHRAQVNVTAWSRDPGGYRLAMVVGELVRQSSSGFAGLWGDTEVHSCQVTSQRDLDEAPSDGTDNWLFAQSIDFEVVHAASVPTFA